MWSWWLACHPGTAEVERDFCRDRAAGAYCDGDTAVRCDAGGAVADSFVCGDGQACGDGECLSCGLSADAETLVLEADPDGHPARWRTLTVAGSAAEVSADGPIQVRRADGSPAPDASDETLTLFATATGAGRVTLTPPPACDAPTVEVPISAVAPAPIGVGALDAAPWIHRYQVFTPGESVLGWIDPARYSDRAGADADLYVLPHRTADQWALDPDLSDAVAGPVSIAVGDDAAPLWDPPAGADWFTSYDVVADFGGDGRLDPGDLLDGLGEAAFAVVGDPSAPGPYTPQSTTLSVDYLHTMRIYYPSELDELDPMPVVVMSHGNGHDYTWYDYLGEHLASHGYVMIAHRNNTGPGVLTAAATTRENTDVFLGAVPTAGDGVLDGEIDPHALAWIGHSRGGEGVVIAYHQLVQGQFEPETFDASDVRLVSSIAPTVFEDPRQTVNPGEVVYHLMAGSSDGDVTGGVDTPVVQYFRILQNSVGWSAVTYVHGADHNDFNCCGFDDGGWTTGPGPQLDRAVVQRTAKAYYLVLLEATFRGKSDLYEYFSRPPAQLSPDPSVVLATQVKRALAQGKWVIDDFQTHPELDRSSSGEAVTGTVSLWAEGALDDRNGQLTADPGDVMNGMTGSDGDTDPARGMVVEWSDGDDLLLDFALPADHRDLTDVAGLSLRACQATRAAATVALGGPLSFGVGLVDGSGAVVEIDHRPYGTLPEP
ncbi:MAG: hypothetical protein ABMA64_39210, partial [Myxococcota bacterium]